MRDKICFEREKGTPMKQPSNVILQFNASRRKITREQIMDALRDFQPLTQDICICAFPKAGSTRLQQLCHALRTGGGATEEGDIDALVPFLDMQWLTRRDLNHVRTALPRLFKSHLTWNDVPKGMKYIYCVRHPLDVVVSYYNFQNDDIFDADAIGIDDYAEFCFVENPGVWGNYWSHLQGWWGARHRPDVLFLSYERINRDVASAVRRIARFMQIPVNDDLTAHVCQVSSKNAMLERSHERFGGDPKTVMAMGAAMARPNRKPRSTVRRDGHGLGRSALSDATCALFQRIWDREIGAPLGFVSYEALVAELDNDVLGGDE
jgi:hypothetical protein